MPDIKYFMSDKLRKSGNIAGAVQSLNDRLMDYNVLRPVAVLPDFTESGTLPVGTTTIIGNSRPLNPSFVGMDIGCGYQLFAMDINPKSEFLNDYPAQLVFDKTHNDIETYDDKSYKIRKGTSSLQPGELFIIPSNAADAAYLVRGREGLADTYYTINHGCGRKYTRTQMYTRLRKTNFEYMFKGVALNVSYKQMIEEAPVGYKDIQDVLASLEEFKIAEIVAKLKPVGVIVER